MDDTARHRVEAAARQRKRRAKMSTADRTRERSGNTASRQEQRSRRTEAERVEDNEKNRRQMAAARKARDEASSLVSVKLSDVTYEDRLARAFEYAQRLTAIQWDEHPCDVCRRQMFDLDVKKTRIEALLDLGFDYVCKRCRQEKATIPRLSRLNGMDPADTVPECLSRLSMAEALLISRIHPQIQVYKLKGGNNGYSGHSISVFSDVQAVAAVLPHPPSSVPIVCVRKLFHNSPRYADFVVRREYVRDALMFLTSPQDHPPNLPDPSLLIPGSTWRNPAYADVQIDWDRINQLPADAMLPVLLDDQQHESAHHDAVDGVILDNHAPDTGGVNTFIVPGPVSHPPDDQLDARVVHLGLPVVPGIADLDVSVTDIVRDMLQLDRANSVPANMDAAEEPFILPVHYDQVVNERNQRYMLAMAFPTLFPYGYGDCTAVGDSAGVKPTLREAMHHYAGHHSGRFSQHPTFNFFMQDLVSKRTAMSTASIYVTRNMQDSSLLTAKDLKDMLNSAEDDTAAYKIVGKLCCAYMSAMKGSTAFWYRERCKATAWMESLPQVPVLFYTVSFADNYAFHLHRLLDEHLGLPPVPNETDAQRRERHRRNVQANPHVACMYFERMAEAFRTYLRDLLGVRDFWDRNEFQGRATVHMHGLGRIDDFEDVDILLDALFELDDGSEAFRTKKQTIEEKLARLVELTGITAVHPAPDSLHGPAPAQNHLELQFETILPDERDEHYIRVVNRAMIHHCRDGYCVRKDGSCRMHFPRPLSDRVRVCLSTDGLKPEVTYARNAGAENVVPHIKIMVMAMMANICVEVVLDTDKVLQYVTKYITKGENCTLSTVQTLRDVCASTAPEKPLATVIRRVFLKQCAHDMGSHEVCYNTLGLPLSHCSHSFVFINSASNMRHLAPVVDGEDPAVADNLTDRYERRPNELRDISLYHYAANYRKDQKRKYPVVPVALTAQFRYTPDLPDRHEAWCKEVIGLHFPWPLPGGLSSLDPAAISAGATTWTQALEPWLCSSHCPPVIRRRIMIAERKRMLQRDKESTEDSDKDEDSDGELQMMFGGAAPLQAEQGAPDPILGVMVRNSFDDVDDAEELGADLRTSPQFIATIDATRHQFPQAILDITTWYKQEKDRAKEGGGDGSRATRAAEGIPNWEQSLLIEEVKRRHAFKLSTGQCDQLLALVSGTAGTGKSFVINKICDIVTDSGTKPSAVLVCAPTGAAAANISGETVHSAFMLPVKDCKELQGRALSEFQCACLHLDYVVIDERSMLGRQTLGHIDQRLRQGRPWQADHPFGGCSVLLFGDYGQLPPVGAPPLYDARVPAHHLQSNYNGVAAYQAFNKSFVLRQVMRQAGPEQKHFRQLLLRLRDGEVHEEDRRLLFQRQLHILPEAERMQFCTAGVVHLMPTNALTKEHNTNQLQKCVRERPHFGPVRLLARHKGAREGIAAAKNVPSSKVMGLEPCLHLAVNCPVMLRYNLNTNAGLVNGTTGTVRFIVYDTAADALAEGALPLFVIVDFPSFRGKPFFQEPERAKWVPITAVERAVTMCLPGRTEQPQVIRTQFPLSVAYAMTIHKSQGMTLERAVIDVGQTERSCGLSYVALSRVRTLEGIAFKDGSVPFARWDHLKSDTMKTRIVEDARLNAVFMREHDQHGSASTSAIQDGPSVGRETLLVSDSRAVTLLSRTTSVDGSTGGQASRSGKKRQRSETDPCPTGGSAFATHATPTRSGRKVVLTDRALELRRRASRSKNA